MKKALLLIALASCEATPDPKCTEPPDVVEAEYYLEDCAQNGLRCTYARTRSMIYDPETQEAVGAQVCRIEAWNSGCSIWERQPTTDEVCYDYILQR